MFRRLFLFLLVFLLGGYTAAEVAAKAYAEAEIEDAAAERDPLARGTDAQVSFPVIYQVALRGQIDQVVLQNTHVDLGPFLADEVRATLSAVQIDRAASMSRRQPVVRAIDRVESVILISQEEFSKALPEGVRAEFGSGSAKLVIAGAEIQGRMEAGGGSSVKFVPDAGRSPPGVPGSFKLSDRPFPCEFEVAVEPGVLSVSCLTEDPPVDWINAR